MDVKWCPSWEQDVGVKAVNIMNEASNLQHMYPFSKLRRQKCYFDFTGTGQGRVDDLAG